MGGFEEIQLFFSCYIESLTALEKCSGVDYIANVKAV